MSPLEDQQGEFLREEDFQELPEDSIAEKRRLMHLADRSEKAGLAVHAEGEEVILHILDSRE